jgi:hypothetical protein
MAPVRNARVLFSKVPAGFPVAGQDLTYDDTATIDLDTVPLNGGVLVRVLSVSIDPYLRGRMRAGGVSYTGAFTLGAPLQNQGVAQVIRSEHEKYKKGDYIYSHVGFEEYSVIPPQALAGPVARVLDNKENLDWNKWTGALGMPGLTAYSGLFEIGKPKKGETIFISAASGAVGQIVGQLAKAQGLIVIGSAGSDDKVKFLKDELKFDHAFNYKTQDTATELAKFKPIDIYWENVGGETLDAVINAANTGCRIVACGMISQYNTANPYGVKNLIQIVGKQILFQGFIVMQWWAKWAPEFYEKMPALLASGELKSLEDVTIGLENGPEATVGIFHGKNMGKAVIQVWDGKSQ